MTRNQRMRDPEDLIAVLGRLIRLLPAIGSGLISASAVGAIIGGLYLLAFFEGAHAGWAMDQVASAVIIRVGLIGAGAFVMAIAGAFALVLSEDVSLRTIYSITAVYVVAILALLGTRFWAPSAFLARSSALIDLGILISCALAIAWVMVIMIVLRIDGEAVRRRLVTIGIMVGTLSFVIVPLQLGHSEGVAALGSEPSGYHPDVCIKTDPTPWRLVHAFDGRALVAHVNGTMKNTMRLVENTEIELLIPAETEGGSASVCSSLARKKPG